MLKTIIITMTLALSPLALADTGSQRECFRYTYMKSSMNETNAKKSCEKIDNKFSLACTKMALAYMGRANQKGLLESCSTIRNDKALTCVIQKAMQATSEHSKAISRCS